MIMERFWYVKREAKTDIPVIRIKQTETLAAPARVVGDIIIPEGTRIFPLENHGHWVSFVAHLPDQMVRIFFPVGTVLKVYQQSPVL